MSRLQKLSQLTQETPVVLPSMLLCDFANLEREIDRLHAAGVRGLHLDVMDGVFVPNMTYGLPIVEAFRSLTELPIDVHLMIADPEKYVAQFADAGADMITFHVEAVEDPRPVLERIRDCQIAAGIALNPATSVASVADCLEFCDLVCMMSVNAGFGGQSFQPHALDKLRECRTLCGDHTVLEIDGGVNVSTIAECVDAGAQLLVAGSAIFNHDDYAVALQDLHQPLTASS